METGQVPVHGANLRYAASQLNAQGIPFQVMGGGGGVYVIVIPVAAMPAVQGAPWAYQQPGRWAALARFPWVRVALVVAALAGGFYLLQAAGLSIGWLAAGAAPVVTPAPTEPASAIDQVLDAVAGLKADIDTQIEERTTEAKQEIGEAVTSMVIGAVALPLTAIAVLGAAWFGLRMYRRGR